MYEIFLQLPELRIFLTFLIEVIEHIFELTEAPTFLVLVHLFGFGSAIKYVMQKKAQPQPQPHSIFKIGNDIK